MNCKFDFSNCGCNRSDELDCLTNTLADCGCSVYPTWELFQDKLNNPAIINNLEIDGNYTTVELLDDATEAQVLAVAGIGPASLADLQVAMDCYNVEINP